MAGRVFEVFAREGHDDSMVHLGSLRAESVEAAQSATWHTYDGFKSIEMWLVPREEVVRVDAASGAMDEGVLEEDAMTVKHDPTDREELS
jgi:1,2-phenylacetyl-CoA epoxidase PaaB subunit